MKKTAIIITSKNNKEMIYALNILMKYNPFVTIFSTTKLIGIDDMTRVISMDSEEYYSISKFDLLKKLSIRSPNTNLRKIKLQKSFRENIYFKKIIHLMIYYLRDVLKFGCSYDHYIKNYVPLLKGVHIKTSDYDKVIYCPSTLDDRGEAILKEFLLNKIKIHCWVYSWDNIYKTNQIIKSSDKFIVWNDTMKFDLSAMYNIFSKKVLVCSPLQFRYINDLNQKNKIYFNKKKVLYICCGGSDDKLIDINAIKEIHNILEAIDSEVELIVRLYPNVTYLETEIDQIQISHRVTVINSKKQEKINDYLKEKIDQLYNASLIINVGTTLILEAVHLSSKIIQMGYLPNFDENLKANNILKYEHIEKMLNHEANSCVVRNKQELASLIQKKLFTDNKSEIDEELTNFFKKITNQFGEKKFGDKFLEVVS